LIGTYPNIIDDAMVFMAIFLLFSYLREPSLRVGLTITLVGIAGVFMHSSFLLFLAALWLLLPVLFLLHRKKTEIRRYFQVCFYSTVGIFVAALVALPFLKGNLGRVIEAYSIAHFVGGATQAQLLQNFAVIYSILAYNIVFLIKPVNLIAIGLGFILVAMKGRQSLGQVFVALWLAIVLVMSLLSGETDRFVLFSMVPAIFLVGNLVGNVPFPGKTGLKVNRRIVVACVLLVLVLFGGFLPLLSFAYSPSRRLHEQNIYASMVWLEENRCPSGVATLGLDLDFRYLPVLTNVQYSASLPAATNSDEVLRESTAIGFSCVVMQTDNPNLHSFELDQAFQERYRNSEVVIFSVAS